MTDRDDNRIVYSTGRGKLCPRCGWPVANCQCSGKRAGAEAIPSRIVAKLRLEKKGRAGKSVTVVYDLPRNVDFLKGLSQELKRACGAGGTIGDDTIELQGDLTARVRALLQSKGFVVKG